MPHYDFMASSGFFEHFDRVEAIKKIEERDIQPLIDQGVARMIHDGDGEKCDLFGVCGPIRMHSRVYEVYLSPGLPSMIREKVRIRFWYDEKAQRAILRIRVSEYALLERFLFPHYKGNGHSYVTEDRAVYWGEPHPWKQKITGKPVKVPAKS